MEYDKYCYSILKKKLSIPENVSLDSLNYYFYEWIQNNPFNISDLKEIIDCLKKLKIKIEKTIQDHYTELTKLQGCIDKLKSSHIGPTTLTLENKGENIDFIKTRFFEWYVTNMLVLLKTMKIDKKISGQYDQIIDCLLKLEIFDDRDSITDYIKIMLTFEDIKECVKTLKNTIPPIWPKSAIERDYLEPEELLTAQSLYMIWLKQHINNKLLVEQITGCFNKIGGEIPKSVIKVLKEELLKQKSLKPTAKEFYPRRKAELKKIKYPTPKKGTIKSPSPFKPVLSVKGRQFKGKVMDVIYPIQQAKSRKIKYPTPQKGVLKSPTPSKPYLEFKTSKKSPLKGDIVTITYLPKTAETKKVKYPSPKKGILSKMPVLLPLKKRKLPPSLPPKKRKISPRLETKISDLKCTKGINGIYYWYRGKKRIPGKNKNYDTNICKPSQKLIIYLSKTNLQK